ncbi:MAG: 30S ribosomal protein S20 [Planctomycetes bacterium]|nr:30S ribosomal protein S20 [Planctomycetota bacterium]
MAHSAQARKRHRQNEKRRAHNRAVKSDLRHFIKRYRTAATAADAKAGEVLKTVESKLDKAAKRNIIPTGRANRLKARLKRMATTAAKK